MQWWTKAPSERAEALLRWMMRRGFPLLIWLAPRIPRWVLVAGAWLIINVVMMVYPAPKRAARINLARVLGRDPRDRVVGRATRRLVHSFGMAWADLFSLGQMSRDALLKLVVTRNGVEVLDRVHAEGKGAILLTAHLGPWEVGAIIVRSLGMPISIVYVPDRFAEAEHFRSLLRRGAAGDVEEIALDLEDQLSTLPALRALSAGRLLAMQGDRDFNGRGTAVSFFGRQVRFPIGPLLLARMTGAAVVPSFVLYRDDFTVAVEVGEPFAVAKTSDRSADVDAALRHWAGILEDAVRRHPTQWFTFYDLFTQSAAEPPGAVASVPMQASEV